jgi:hypothetical protein
VGVRAHALLELAGRPRRRETRAAGFEKIDFLNVVLGLLSVVINSNEVERGQVAQIMMKIGLKGP